MLSDLKLFNVRFTTHQLNTINKFIHKVNKAIPFNSSIVMLKLVELQIPIDKYNTYDKYIYTLSSILKDVFKDITIGRIKGTMVEGKSLYQPGFYNKWLRSLDLDLMEHNTTFIKVPTILVKSAKESDSIDYLVKDYLRFIENDNTINS